jgi:hypothetical protein
MIDTNKTSILAYRLYFRFDLIGNFFLYFHTKFYLTDEFDPNKCYHRFFKFFALMSEICLFMGISAHVKFFVTA